MYSKTFRTGDIPPVESVIFVLFLTQETAVIATVVEGAAQTAVADEQDVEKQAPTTEADVSDAQKQIVNASPSTEKEKNGNKEKKKPAQVCRNRRLKTVH